ncbi:nucleoside diphosphate kinase regulator [Sphingobium sp. EM0848]|uniref:nucleoside diphosphate kinase regulator n=1 Tax=Sphingobium sp. EM0848 TaxID=2743473 RepID=UPI00159CABC9|nr:nucleoside diphosphate kinase regulator [Sphingobium sp. EM0848]
MTRMPNRAKPPVHLIDIEAEGLTNLALGIADTMPQVSELLLDEIARAQTHRAERIPPDVVTMHSSVEFVDEASGVDRTVQIVYPAQADIAAGRISILTPIAAGLIGLREGQSISWPDREGRERKLTIVKVTQPTRI